MGALMDEWAAYKPVGAPVVAPPISAPNGDQWAAYNPVATPLPEEGWGDKLSQLWPARLAKAVAHGVYSGVTLPGDVAQGKVQVDPSNPEFIGRTLDLASVASPVTPRSAASLSPAMGAPSADALGTAANNLYKQVENSGVEYTPESVVGLAENIGQKLQEKRLREGRAPETHASLSQMASPPAGAVSTIDDLQYAKQVFGDIVANPQKYSAADRKAAGIAKQHIEGFIGNPDEAAVLAGDAQATGQALRQADKNYAAKMRSEQITGAQDVAEGNAAAANSGRNIDNAYRQRFNAILKSDKQSVGFSPEEIARMEALRDGSMAANSLRYVGNHLAGVGGQTAGFLGALYNPYLAAVPLAGHLLKKGADFSTLRQIKSLDEATRMRSALGEEYAATSTMTPAEQLRQSALIKALMASGPQAGNAANNGTIDPQAFARMLQQGNGL